MDASTLRALDTGTLHLKDASGTPLYEGDKPVRIVLHSPASRQFATVTAKQSQRALKLMADNDGKLTIGTAEQQKRDETEDLTALTIRFEGLTHGDKTGADLFAAVYSDPALGFINKQVVKHLADWANFSNASIAS